MKRPAKHVIGINLVLLLGVLAWLAFYVLLDGAIDDRADTLSRQNEMEHIALQARLDSLMEAKTDSVAQALRFTIDSLEQELRTLEKP